MQVNHQVLYTDVTLQMVEVLYMKVTSTFVATQIYKQAYINPELLWEHVLKTIENPESWRTGSSATGSQRGDKGEEKPGRARGEWMRQKETREVEPRSMPKNNSQELPGPLPSLRGERPWCWTPASLVGYLLRHTALTEARDGAIERWQCVCMWTWMWVCILHPGRRAVGRASQPTLSLRATMSCYPSSLIC